MTPNSKPWQAIVTGNITTAPVVSSTNLSVVKKGAAVVKTVVQGQVLNPKRYSFDDNGGGYLGL